MVSCKARIKRLNKMTTQVEKLQAKIDKSAEIANRDC